MVNNEVTFIWQGSTQSALTLSNVAGIFYILVSGLALSIILVSGLALSISGLALSIIVVSGLALSIIVALGEYVSKVRAEDADNKVGSL